MPIIIPYVVLIISIYLVIGPIIDNPQIEYLYALSFIFAGLIFYVPFVKFGMTPRFMSESIFIEIEFELKFAFTLQPNYLIQKKI